MHKIVTIGVYGFDEDSFFRSLLAAHVDLFCDIRARRGVRGSLYTFANSQQLQKKLAEIGIQYTHMQELAPSQAMRDYQKHEDESAGIARRKRQVLGSAFIQAYQQERLSSFDALDFSNKIGLDKNIICFFCVESKPEACHRSLVAEKLAKDLHLPIEHIKSPMIR